MITHQHANDMQVEMDVETVPQGAVVRLHDADDRFHALAAADYNSYLYVSLLSHRTRFYIMCVH